MYVNFLTFKMLMWKYGRQCLTGSLNVLYVGVVVAYKSNLKMIQKIFIHRVINKHEDLKVEIYTKFSKTINNDSVKSWILVGTSDMGNFWSPFLIGLQVLLIKSLEIQKSKTKRRYSNFEHILSIWTLLYFFYTSSWVYFVIHLFPSQPSV